MTAGNGTTCTVFSLKALRLRLWINIFVLSAKPQKTNLFEFTLFYVDQF